MLVDLLVEGLAQDDHVFLIIVIDGLTPFVETEPQLHRIKEVETGPVNKGAAGGMIFRPEEDCRGEDTFESVFDSPVVEAVGLKVKEGEHLGGTLKADSSALLFQGKRRNPNGDEPVLTEGQTVIGMAEYLKKKFAAVPRMCQLIFRWTAQGQPAQNEWPRIERKFLSAGSALLTDEADRFYLLESPFGDAKTGKDFAHLLKGRIRRPWETLLGEGWSGHHG